MIPPLGILTTDAQLRVRTWDDWLVRVTGISADDARGKSLTALIPDLEARGLLARFQRVLTEGAAQVLATAFHQYLIPCPPTTPSKFFDKMQQRITLAPLKEDERIVGVMATIEDVTAQRERERELMEHLTSTNEETRRHATEQLALTEDTAPSLTHALGDESWRVRRIAVNGLARSGSEEAVAALIRALRDEHHDLGVLNSALQVLAMGGVDTLTPLVEFLRGAETDLRIYAAQALGEQRDARAIPPLLDALNDADANVRYHVIEALGKLRATDAIEPLVTLALSDDFFLSFPALDALARIGDPQIAPRIVPLLQNDLLRAPAADLLGKLGDVQVLPPLAALLNLPDAPTFVIANALAAIYERYETQFREGAHVADLARGAINAAGAQNLIAALDAAHDQELTALALVLGWLEGTAVERALTRLLGQPAARQEVVEALVRHGHRVTELLIEQLDAEDLETRQAAVVALGRIGDPRAVPALTRILLNDPESVILAAGALAKIGDRRAYQALIEFLGHESVAVRQAVISALNSLGHPDMARDVVAWLRDANPRARESAVRIAGYFGFPEAVDALLECTRDADENVRRAAIENLPYLDDPRALDILMHALKNGTPPVRASAARAFVFVEDKQTLPLLLDALRDEDLWVRYFAARSLGHHRFAEAIDALGELARNDSEAPVRMSAIEALGRIGGARVVAILAPLTESRNNDIAREAMNALGKIAHPDALPPLLAALRSRDAERRIDALSALGMRGGDGIAETLQWVAASDGDERVVRAAIDALAQTRTPEAVNALIALTADRTRRELCIAALAHLSPVQIEWMGKGLAHPQASVRAAVVEALARMKNVRATELLGRGLDDADAAVRLAAVSALAHLDARVWKWRLHALAHNDPDPAVRHAAQTAMGKM